MITQASSEHSICVALSKEDARKGKKLIEKDKTEFVPDDQLWHFLAYCAGTGGSMLIIGSAAGVVAMGMEKITFGWYLKKILWIALVGYFAGIAVFMLMRNLI